MEKVVKLLKYHPEQAQVFDCNKRYIVACCGRRWGKTQGAITRMVERLFEKKNKLGWWVAPVYSQAKIAYRYFLKLYPQAIKRKNDSELRIELWNNAIFECKSADNPEYLRGEGLDELTLDECGTMKEAVWKEILRPAVMDTQGSVVFIGTPKGENWFYDMYQEGLKGLDNIQSFSFSSYGNPYIERSEIEEAKMEMPERLFQQEIMAQFLEDIGGVFRNVRECATGKFEDPERGVRYWMGVDLGKYEDFTVITVIKQAGNKVSVVSWDRFRDISWTLQEQRIVEIAKRYDAHILLDTGQVGDRVLDSIALKWRRIEGVLFTNTNKNAMINFLSLLIERKQIEYPDIPELINELRMFQYELTPSRNIRMQAPEGKHDDCVISLALSCWNIKDRLQKVEEKREIITDPFMQEVKRVRKLADRDTIVSQRKKIRERTGGIGYG